MRSTMPISIAFGIVLFLVPTLAGGTLAASRFEVVPLVSDQPGVAPNTDPDLVNAWGLAPAPGGLEWVSDNGTDKSTIYDRNTGAKQSLVINIPPGAPTGVVHVPRGTGFEITANGKSAPATFLFDTESGFIEGWNFNTSALTTQSMPSIMTWARCTRALLSMLPTSSCSRRIL